ncbi:MAG TPA: hypothetical protein ENI86_10160 [Acidimicrobiales bacterium]|nr:hypothetical protein [Acidimicrobiales bacterium]
MTALRLCKDASNVTELSGEVHVDARSEAELNRRCPRRLRFAVVLMGIGLILSACSSGGPATTAAADTAARSSVVSIPPTSPTSPASSTTAPAATPTTPGPAVEAGAPSFRATVALEPDHALIGRLVVDGPEDLRPEVLVNGSERSFVVPVTTAGPHHEIPIVGLRAESTYEITVGDGMATRTLELTTGPVPAEFPDFEIAVADTGSMSEGFTLFDLLDVTDQLSGVVPDDGSEPPRDGYLVAVDAEGEVVWYHRADHSIGDVRQLLDGTLLHEYNDTAARRIDLFGRTVEEWAGSIITGPLEFDAYGRRVVGQDATPVDVDSMHHELAMLPDGDLLTLSTELITLGGFPKEGLCGEPLGIDGTYDLISDVIVEFAPSGEVVARYPLIDYLDPVNRPEDQNVCGLPFDQVFPNWLYRAQGFDRATDWTHANAVVVDPTGRYLTVSVRHQDAILQIDRTTGELAWRFGPGGDFELTDPAGFAYHQHAIEWQGDGTLLLYDNGNGRPGTARGPDDGLPPPYSRAVQYRLDPDSGTAEVVWEYRSEIDGEPVFAAFVGDADRLDNGNVLVVNGGLNSGRPDGITAQIVEVVPDSDGSGGEVVFDLRVAAPGRNLVIYRAERIESFYP